VTRLGRPGGLSAGKKELWKRWRAGESISDIARALESLPAPSTGCSKPPEGSLLPNGTDEDVRSPPPSRRRSPESMNLIAAWPENVLKVVAGNVNVCHGRDHATCGTLVLKSEG
jgi:hypothetical protein